MERLRIVGVDPGIDGAAAAVETTGRGLCTFVDVIDLPSLGEGSQREIDDLELIRWLRWIAPSHAFIELVSAMPSIPDENPESKNFGKRRGMGAASAFKFGFGCGQIRTSVRGCKIPINLVVPRVWKKLYMLKGANKEPSRQKAIQLHPEASEKLKRKKDHQRAESILIARYGAIILCS